MPTTATRADGLNLVVIEDHLALRDGLVHLLTRIGHHVIGVTDNADEGARLISRRRPDVAIVDIGLPGESGTSLCRRIAPVDKSTPILIYTGVSDLEQLRRELDCGARGFCLKTSSRQELSTALETLAGGGTYVDPRLKPLLSPAMASKDLLSPREKEVLSLLAQGRTGQQAASELHLSPLTIRTHIRNAVTKLGATTRTHAAVLALSRGEISADPRQFA